MFDQLARLILCQVHLMTDVHKADAVLLRSADDDLAVLATFDERGQLLGTDELVQIFSGHHMQHVTDVCR